MKNAAKIIVCTLCAALLLLKSTAIRTGITAGMELCVKIVIPSLFPFMVLTSFLTLSGWSSCFSAVLSPITRILFRLPEGTGTTVFMSFLGGYPVGAKMIARLIQENTVSAAQGERMLSFCVNAGPSFVLTAVGIGMFHSKGIGALLLAAHILASLTTGIIGGIGNAVPPKDPSRKKPSSFSAASAMIQSVSDSSAAMLTLCSFVILFSGILELMQNLGFSVFLEVTKGCLIASQMHSIRGELLAAFLLSFGGLSIICQTAAGFSSLGTPLHWRRYLFQRTVCGGVSCLWYSLLRTVFRDHIEQTAAVYNWIPTELAPVAQTTDITFPLTLCLLAVCAIAAMALEDTIS